MDDCKPWLTPSWHYAEEQAVFDGHWWMVDGIAVRAEKWRKLTLKEWIERWKECLKSRTSK